MKTKVFNWKENIDELELNEVIKTIKEDGIIIFPTDTVYGIACNCFSEKAINKIFNIKERIKEKPINVLTDSVEKINLVVETIREKEQLLIDIYFPGALTIILDKKENVPDILTSNLKTIGVRIPNNKIALTILEKIPYPLATTSANLSGEEAGTKINDFIEFFDGKVDIIIDGGITKIKQASTIVRVENDEVKILREGSIKIDKIQKK